VLIFFIFATLSNVVFVKFYLSLIFQIVQYQPKTAEKHFAVLG